MFYSWLENINKKSGFYQDFFFQAPLNKIEQKFSENIRLDRHLLRTFKRTIQHSNNRSSTLQQLGSTYTFRASTNEKQI